MLESLPHFFSDIRWQDVIDFLIIYYLIFRILLLLEGTRAMQMLIGCGVVISFFLLSKYLGLYTVYVVLKELLSPLVIILIIIFQDDIRRALTRFAQNPLFVAFKKAQESQVLDEVLRAAYSMAEKRVGAIIVLERETGLKNYIEEGFKLNSDVTAEMLISIFLPYGPMHDGAVVIKGDRIIAAGCFLPSTTQANLPKQYGARYRAAMGLSEECDALVLVVSEETSEVSLVVDGKVEKGSSQAELKAKMLKVMERETKA